MRCDYPGCHKQATFHITDIESGTPHSHHFCEEHARQFLQQPVGSPNEGGSLEELVATPGTKSPVTRTSKPERPCDNCQITFAEFRATGRLGCPRDYEIFRDDLMPLLENIHGETRHTGKTPRRAPLLAQQQTQLMQLRSEMREAIAREDYEHAAQLRDLIQGIESSRSS